MFTLEEEEEDAQRPYDPKETAAAAGSGSDGVGGGGFTGGAGVYSTSGRSGTGSKEMAPVDSGSDFVNLQRYLDTNANAGQQMATSAADAVKTSGKAVEDQAAQQYNAFNQALQTGQSSYTSGDPNSYKGYSGPTTYDDGGAQAQAQSVAEQAKNLGSYEGIQANLQDQYGKNGANYSAGNQRLDAALAQSYGGPAFKDTEKFQKLANVVNNYHTQADQAIQSAQGQDTNNQMAQATDASNIIAQNKAAADAEKQSWGSFGARPDYSTLGNAVGPTDDIRDLPPDIYKVMSNDEVKELIRLHDSGAWKSAAQYVKQLKQKYGPAAQDWG